jgi:hypothetical protein
MSSSTFTFHLNVQCITKQSSQIVYPILGMKIVQRAGNNEMLTNMQAAHHQEINLTP